MTASESSAIARLRDELHKYHVEVVKLAENCESCQTTLMNLAVDMYGVAGEKETHPGVMGHIESLRRSRKLILLALRGAWVLLTILLGAVATAVLQVRL